MARFETVTEAVFAKATSRGSRFGAIRAVGARFDRRSGRIVIRMSTGLDVSFSPKDAEGLESAAVKDLSGVEVTGAGWTLHFPELDADFSIPRLMAGFLGSTDWLKRETRAIASRENGKRGGRPRKTENAA